MIKKIHGLSVDFPAVELSIAGKTCTWEYLGGELFRSGDMTMSVRYFPIAGGFRKVVEITSEVLLPTPDYLIIDKQTIPDPALKMRGYIASSGKSSMELSDEEGGGLMPGCGYPLIGKKYFVALEHQAGFNIVRQNNAADSTYELRQHPVWENGRLTTMSALVVKAADPEAAFRKYLDGIKLPGADRALFSFCSFWSEPYTGNYEYIIGGDNYRSFVRAFTALGLTPDVYTLDAGWQDRNSIFTAKVAAGGDPGLVKLRKFFEKNHAGLSLWVSHNGPMGMAPEYLQRNGIAVGSGFSSTYRGNGFGVLMDEKLEQLLTERFCELVDKNIGAVHLKMDWDNDCATNENFKAQYPTRNHVREASVNVQNRIAGAIRMTNPGVKIRHGWWPSPWQLRYAEHIFLADSGDCEYCSVPALNQRDCTFTARDIQYYNHFRRDGSMIPLNSIDNHDFPQAPRNPFTGDDAVWSNAALWAVMRGTGYQPWKLQPEALTGEQCRILRETMQFARNNEKIIFSGKSFMTGGNPRHGEIYGFVHPSPGGALIALRNPLPIPQVLTAIPECPEISNVCQLYPDIRNISLPLTFAPHEVKILQKTPRKIKLAKYPFQMIDGKAYYPASANVSAEISPLVAEVYQVPEFSIMDAVDQQIPGGIRYWFKLRAPYRMQNCALTFRLTGAEAGKVVPRLYLARDARTTGNCYAVPLTEIFSGNPGRGEYQNPEEKTEWGRFFHAQVPCGGTGCYRLELRGKKCEIELWASGYETLSRQGGVLCAGAEKVFAVPRHPFGFPHCAKMELCGSEPPVCE